MEHLPPSEELRLLRRLVRFRDQLRVIRDVGKIVRFALRETRDAFAADVAILAVLRPGAGTEVLAALPRADGLDLGLAEGFIRNLRPAIPASQLLAPVWRRGAAWGALALGRRDRPFERDLGRMLARFAGETTEAIARIDQARLDEVRGRIDRKVMEQLPPNDLFYQILHGLRSLTGYDHSSALLIGEDDLGRLRLVAEQVAWAKGKSRRIGTGLALDDDLRRELGRAAVQLCVRDGEEWRDRAGGKATRLAALLDYNRDGAGPREMAMLCAPFVTREGLAGVLKIAGLGRSTFVPDDASLVARFVSQAAQAIDNSRRTESLQTRMVAAERKHVLAELARGVSHDVNNALGAVLPLVQQIRAELAEGRLDGTALAQDLDQIERSLQVCRRIFGGMLSFARSRTRRPSPARVDRAVDDTLAIVADGMERRGVALVTEVAPDLPAVRVSQSDLEQVLLNLLVNAREAILAGGTVTIRARREPGLVRLEVQDSGLGMPPEVLARVQEPFFSTKPEGSGLGLSICRSILWEAEGEIEIDSQPGAGTVVRVKLPEAGEGGG